MKIDTQTLTKLLSMSFKNTFELLSYNDISINTDIDVFWIFNTESGHLKLNELSLIDYFRSHDLYDQTSQYNELKELYIGDEDFDLLVQRLIAN